MKTIIILLLFNSAALFSQDSINDDSLKMERYYDIIDNIFSEKHFAAVYYEDYINAIFEYEKECYNDSTLIKVNVNKDKNVQWVTEDGIVGTSLMYFPPVWEDKWVHKEPTFSDFILWLHKKLKTY